MRLSGYTKNDEKSRRAGLCVCLLTVAPLLWAAPPHNTAPRTDAQPREGMVANDAKCPTHNAPAAKSTERASGKRRAKSDARAVFHPPAPTTTDPTTDPTIDQVHARSDTYGPRYAYAAELQRSIEDMRRMLGCGNRVVDDFGAQGTWDVIDDAARDKASTSDAGDSPI